MKNFTVLTFALACFCFVSTAAAQTVIGNGFTCSGTSILKGTKLVAYKKAKSNITQTISKLKGRLETAKKSKKAGLKAQIQSARAAKELLVACNSGTLSPSAVDPFFTNLASGTGIYNGTYSGVVSGFLPISGDIQFVFELEGTVFGATLSLGGNLGNTLNAEPLAFQNDVGGIGLPAQFVLNDTFIGTVTLVFNSNGHISITNSNSTTGPVDFEGDFLNQTITSTLEGSYKGIPFSGDATLNRQP